MNQEDQSTVKLSAIVEEVNVRARGHQIGALQEIRAELKGLIRKSRDGIFSPQSTHDDWACHHGGRSELQFNLGLEPPSKLDELRHGVAFSFEPSRSLPDPVETLAPKVRRFNEFIALYPTSFADMRMWHFEKGVRTGDYMPSQIPWERVQRNVFVFLGKRQPLTQIDYDLVLHDFDRLLELYRYVEGPKSSAPVPMPPNQTFQFRSGCTVKASSATWVAAQRQVDLDLRHNQLQEALFGRLSQEHGEENVRAENPSGVGTRIDVVVRQKDEFWFYEIKTFESPRACIREAIGQLLEYSFWPGAKAAARLVIVGETPLDEDGKQYLNYLRTRFSLPIDYEQISI